ncbi:hypothetical protein D3C86_1690160 [compost metagenome]
MEVAPFMTSIRSITLGSIVRRSRAPFISGVDCGIPSINTSTARPRSVCPEFVALLVEVPNPGIAFPNTVAKLLVILVCA